MNAHHFGDVKWDKPHLLLSAADLEAGVTIESPNWNHLSLLSLRIYHRSAWYIPDRNLRLAYPILGPK